MNEQGLRELLDKLITTKAEVSCALENAYGCGEQGLRIQKGIKDFIILVMFDMRNIALPEGVASFNSCRPEWLTGRIKEIYESLTGLGYNIKTLCCTDSQGTNSFFCLALAV